MGIQNSSTKVVIVAAAGLVLLALIVFIWFGTTTHVSFDAAFGLLTWSSMTKGAGFNHLRIASPQDMAVDRDFFWAAHSPGQYFFPGIITMTGVKLGTALRIVEFLAVGLGLFGYYLLFTRVFGFARSLSMIAVAIILINRSTLDYLINYSGGQLLQFASMPFFLMAAMWCLKRRGVWTALVLLVFLTGAFLKLSFALIALGVVIATILQRLVHNRLSVATALQSGLDAGAFAAFYFVLYLIHTSRGLTAAHPGFGSAGTLGFFTLYSLSCIGSGAVSLFQSLSRIGYLFQFVHPTPRLGVEFLIIAGVAAMSLLALFLALRTVRKVEYRTLLLGLAAVHVPILTSLFLGGLLIAEDRHFWPVSVMLIPGILHFLWRVRSQRFRAVLAGLLALPLIYGPWSHRYNFWLAMTSGRSTKLGISFPRVNQDLVDFISELDDSLTDGRNVFFFHDPGLALLVDRNPVLVSIAAFGSPPYQGNIDRLVVIPAENVPPQEIVSMFPAQWNWQTGTVGGRVVLHSGLDVPRPPRPTLRKLQMPETSGQALQPNR